MENMEVTDAKIKFGPNVRLESNEVRRRKREEKLVQLRKERRKKDRLKKYQSTFLVNFPETISLEQRLLGFKNMLNLITCDCKEHQVEALMAAAKYLTDKSNIGLFTQIFIDSNLLNQFIKLAVHGSEEMQTEMSFLFLNASAGSNSDHTNYFLNSGILQPLILLLTTANDQVVENVVWTLGNYMDGDYETRNRILNTRVIPPLYDLVKKHRKKVAIMKALAFTLSKVCQTTTPADTSLTESIFEMNQCLSALSTLILMADLDIIENACYCLYYITCCGDKQINQVLRAGVIQRIIQLLRCGSSEIVTICAKIIGNISWGDDSQIELLVRCGALPTLVTVLASCACECNEDLAGEAAFALSNISAGAACQEASYILDSGAFEGAILILKYRTYNMLIRRDALRLIHKVSSVTGIQRSIWGHIFQNNVVGAITDILKVKQADVVLMGLKALHSIFKLSKMHNQWTQLRSSITEETIDALEDLCYHIQPKITKKVCAILDHYFGNGLEDNDECAVPGLPHHNGSCDCDMEQMD